LKALALHMRHFRIILIAASLMCSCAIRSSEVLEDRAQILYFDRNDDGKVDLEKHTHPGVADADWELRDDDYNGKYEKKTRYGFAVRESAVDLPIPTGVKTEKKP